MVIVDNNFVMTKRFSWLIIDFRKLCITSTTNSSKVRKSAHQIDP